MIGLLRILLAAGVLLAPGPAAAQLTVTYVANEGVLLEGGGYKILVDALFGPGIAPYATIPAEMRPALEGGQPPFDGVDLVLATHYHADHFDAATVLRFLQANGKARFVSTPQAVELLRRLAQGETEVLSRVEAALPAEGERHVVQHRGLEIEVLNLHHGRSRNPPVENLGFLARMGGLKWLHVGDTEVVEDDVRSQDLPGEGIDVALLPTWFFGSDRWFRVVEKQIQPRRVVVVHRVGPGASSSYYEGGSPSAQDQRIRRRFPGAVILPHPGDTRTFPNPLP